MPVNNQPQSAPTPSPIPNPTPAPTPTPSPIPNQPPATPVGIQGLSAAEMSDPNSIKVTISDQKAPLVILFGPPACGKTMTLVRLTRFLQKEGYTVSPIRSFRPSYDVNYKNLCDTFDETMNSDNAAASTSLISFMLVEVLKNGRRICQILEAPGEHYANPNEPKAPSPRYINHIISCQNRKIWMIMVEPDWLDQQDRRNYVSRIAHLKQNMRPKDCAVFVFNKIDLTDFVRTPGQVNIPEAIRQVKNLYPNIFVPFMNQNPITKWFKEFNCEFVPFQTGKYNQAINGVTFEEGASEYCVKLWGTILNKIRG